MKNLIHVAIAIMLFSCGGDKQESATSSAAPGSQKLPTSLAEAEASYEKFNGIGPIKPFELTEEVDQELAAEGLLIYNNLCMACHKPTEKFIGPAPAGIMERRTPSWVMNMILNPEQMLAEDPIAKLLYAEYNFSPMANQNLTEDQARAVLEYFRTL